MLKHVVALGLALCPLAASAQPPPTAQPSKPQGDTAPAERRWVMSDETVLFAPARIAFTRRAGGLEMVRQEELSHQGEGIDNAIQYRSADGRIVGTVYVYYPGLPHAGLSAWSTDNAIRLNSESRVVGRGSRVTAAGGAEGVAIRADYSNYRNGNTSTAAFVKAGRWIVKLRVSGPDSRGDEVRAAMDALLAGVRWGAANPPVRATQVTVAGCSGEDGRRAARPLPDPALEEVTAYGLIATFDGGGIEATDAQGARNDLPSRVPPELCLSSLIGGNGPPILRAPAGDARSIDGRTRLLAVLSDSGTMLEVVDASNLGRHILLFHSMGETAMLGSFDGVPSDQQIADMIQGRDRDSTRPRVIARFRPGESVQLHVIPPPEAPVQPVT